MVGFVWLKLKLFVVSVDIGKMNHCKPNVLKEIHRLSQHTQVREQLSLVAKPHDVEVRINSIGALQPLGWCSDGP